MAIAFDQNLGNNVTAVAATTVTLTTAATVAAGGKIILNHSIFDAVDTLSSVSGGGLTWNIDLKASNGSQRYAQASADAPSGLASGTVITCTKTGGTSALQEVSAFSMTGIQTGTTYDGTNSSTAGAGATWSSGAISTSNANDVIAGGGTQDGSGTATASPNGGYTEVNDFTHAANTESYESVYQIVSSTGSYTAGGSFSPSGSQSVGLAIAYKAALVAAASTIFYPLLMKLLNTPVQRWLGFPFPNPEFPAPAGLVLPPLPVVVDTAVPQSVNN